MNPNDDMDALKNKDNILDRIEKLEAKVNNLFTGDTKAVTLDEIAEDLGQLRMGDFIATAGDGDPGDANFTGTFMSANGFTINGTVYNIGGMYQGTLMWAGNSTTGEFEFIGGNAKINADGIVGTDLLKWMIKQDATNDVYTRTGKLGLALKEGGGTIPVWQMSYESPAGVELVTNGGAETGDFTGWTKTTETNGHWQLALSNGYASDGSYSFVFDPTANPATGVLTSDRIAVTGDIAYLVSALQQNFSSLSTQKFEIKWYDHASAGSLISTDVLYYKTTPVSSTISAVYTAPPTALSCEIVLTHTATNTSAEAIVDSISVSAIAVNQKFWLEDDGVECSNGLYPAYAVMWAEDAITTATGFKNILRASQKYGIGTYNSSPAAINGDTYDFYCTLESGTYELKILYLKDSAGGKFDISIDGVDVVTGLDMYASSLVYNLESITSDISIPTSGQHTVRFTTNGKNGSSSSYSLYMTRIALIKTGD